MSLAHFPRIIFGAAILCGNLEIVPQPRFNPQSDRKRSMREERDLVVVNKLVSNYFKA
jgi:hypothetical protein